eukprot:PITA_35102
MYLVNTKPNICYAVNTLSQCMVEQKRAHWATTKHVLRLGRKFSGLESASGYCFNIRSGMTSQCSRKQKSMALSSSEAKYMAASTVSCEAIWLRKLLVNLVRRNMEATRIMDCVQRGVVQLSYTPTGEQVVDILTKALGRKKFDCFRENMGMVKNLFQ